MKVSDRAEHLGSGLLHKGLKPHPDTFIGIFAQNRPEVSEGDELSEVCLLFCKESIFTLTDHNFAVSPFHGSFAVDYW